MKTLLILRHAKSSWTDTRIADHERPLNPRGERDAPRMGAFVRTSGMVPDLIISSDAERARATAEAVAKAARYDGEIRIDSSLYMADPLDLIAALRRVSERHVHAVMVVGHNPGLEELLALLTGEQHALPTASLARVWLPIDDWRDLGSHTGGDLTGLWRPKELA